MATTALAVIGPMAGAVASKATVGSVWLSRAIRASAVAICAFRGVRTASNGASSAANAAASGNSLIRSAACSAVLLRTRSPSRRTSAFATLMNRVRARTSASRTASSARTCRRAGVVRWAGRYAPSRSASAKVRASRRSVFTRRDRVAYIGAKLGSATMTA